MPTITTKPGQGGTTVVTGPGGGKPQKVAPRWGWALLSNLEDFARSVGPGVAHLVKSGWNDADLVLGNALPGKAESFMLDDVGAAIVKDYKTRYGPLLRGDLGAFWDQLATKPLDFIFDAGTIATAGIGAVVTVPAKGITASAKLGKIGQLTAKQARTLERAGYVERTAENLAAAQNVYGARSRQVRDAQELGLVRGVRRATGADSSIVLERMQRMNPLMRKRDELVDAALGSKVASKVPVIGVNARAARQDARRQRVANDVRRQRMLAEPKRAIAQLTPDEQAAWFFLHTDTTPDEYAGFLSKRLEDGELDDRDRLVAEATVERIGRAGVRAAYATPSARLVKAVRATRQLADEDMPDVLTDVTKFTHRQILERRMLQRRILEGGQMVDEHPENLVAREGALRDVAGADVVVPMPGGPRPVSVPGRGAGVRPTREQVEELLTAEERRLVRGKYKGNRGTLKRWLGELYDADRYGGPPSKAQVREEAGLQQSARAREKRRANQSRETAGRVDVLDAMDRYGVWSRQVVRLVDDAGGNRDELWRMVREARMEKLQLTERFPKGTIEQKLLENGYHPTDRMANLPGDDGMVDVIVEWFDEATGGHGVTDIAEGGRFLADSFDGVGGSGWMDDTDAAAWVAEARRLDPDLPRNIDDRDVAYAVASRYQPLDMPHSMPTKREFVDRAFDAILRVFVDLPDEVDAAAELGNIRGPAARVLADRLGLRDPEVGIEPTGQDWAQALAQVARQAGFDERFREQARAVAGSRQRLEVEGVDAFNRAFDREKLDKPEMLNPKTGRLYRDEVADLTDEQLLEQVGDASYAPHKATSRGGGGGRPRAGVTVAGAPAGPRLRRNVGARFGAGNFDMSPMRLLQEAEGLLRAKHADALYNAAVARGIPFDEATFLDTGGAEKWVVLDSRGVKKLAERLDAMTGQVQQIGEQLGEARATELVERLRTMQEESARVAREAGETGDTEGLVMVPRGYFDRLAGDMRESSAWAKAVFDRPLDLFRTSVLFLTGRYYINNIVGQNFLLAVREKGMKWPLEYAAFLKNAGRLKEARELVAAGANDNALAALGLHGLLARYAPELRGASQYDVEVRPGMVDMATRLGMTDSQLKRGIAKMLRFPDAANQFGAYLSDDLPRMFRFGRLLQPHIDSARLDGVEGTDAEIGMQLLEQDEVLRTNLIEQTLGDLIDYRAMGHMERVHVRRWLPFYGWMRGITAWTLELGYNDPASMLALMAIADVGQASNEDWNEQVPEWMTGAVRVGDERDGVQTVINTQGLVPLSTIGDLAGIGQGLVFEQPNRSLAGAQVIGQINPFARSALAAVNKGRDIGSGIPMLMPGQTMSGDGGQAPGMLATMLAGWAGSMPQPMLVSQYRTAADNLRTQGAGAGPVDVLTTPGASSSAVYKSPYWHYLASYFGVPIRDVNLAGARARRERDEAILAGESRVFG